MERELLLLGLLRQANMYGYQLHDLIERELASCVDLKKPTAYFLLDKLTRKGWISQHEERVGSRPPRNVYAITQAGEAHFELLLRANLGSYHLTRFAGDVGLAFADALPPAEVLELLQQRRSLLAADAAATSAAPHHDGSLQLVIEHRLVHLEAELRWLDSVIVRFAAPADTSPSLGIDAE